MENSWLIFVIGKSRVLNNKQTIYIMKQPTQAQIRAAKDDLVIIDCIKKSPTNLSAAFEEAGIKLGRTTRAIMARYYAYLKKQIDNPVLAIGNERGLILNTKNTLTKSGTSNDVRRALIKAAVNVIPVNESLDYLLSHMTDDEQQSLLERMINKLKK